MHLVGKGQRYKVRPLYHHTRLRALLGGGESGAGERERGQEQGGEVVTIVPIGSNPHSHHSCPS